MQAANRAGLEIFLGAYCSFLADHFSVTLRLRDIKRVVQRIKLFRACSRLDPDLHEMVFEDGMGGYFFKGALPIGGEPAEVSFLAIETIVCAFQSTDAASQSSWCVRKDGQLHRHQTSRRYMAVQWRAYETSSGKVVHSDPLWEDEVRSIQEALSGAS